MVITWLYQVYISNANGNPNNQEEVAIGKDLLGIVAVLWESSNQRFVGIFFPYMGDARRVCPNIEFPFTQLWKPISRVAIY